MNKNIHAALSIILVFSVVFVVDVALIPENTDPFFWILFLAPVFVVTLLTFQLIPKKCDQDNCDGLAKFYANPDHKNWLLKRFKFKGHKCEKCGHIIEPPKGSPHRHP